MYKPGNLSFIYLIGVFCLLQSCQAQPPILPSPTPASRPSAGGVSISASQQSSAAVLEACPTSDQEKAMRPSQIPDWQHLGLFACYEIALDLSADAPFPGQETLVFTNSSAEPMNDVLFRTFPNAPAIFGGGMHIESASVDNQPVNTEVLLADHSALRLLLNQPLQPAQTAVIHLDFSLDVPLEFKSNSTYGVFGQSDSGAIFVLANWFPILAVRENGDWQASVVLPGGDAVTSESALFKASITAPNDWKIAATGTEVSTSSTPPSMRHQFVSGPVRDFIVTASPNFEMRLVQSGDIQIKQWGLAETDPTWDQALDTAKTALEYYQKTFGPYPFTELDIAAVPLQYASGVEYPGLILISSKAYLPTSRPGLLQVVVAHETAHQWWYSVIGNNVLRDPWQDEGLTTYSALAYLRAQASPIYPYLLSDYQSQVSAYEREHPNESIAQPVAAFEGRTSAYSTLVYSKAALFFDQVRQRIGDEFFEKALQRYYTVNRYKLVPPVQLLASFTDTCGCDLTGLFRQYGVENITP
jgi:hypothetical protein